MQDLIQMLKEYEIKNVISIDDGWDDTNSLKDKMEKQSLPEDITIKEYCDEYLIEIVHEENSQYEIIKDQCLKDIELFIQKIPETYAEICRTLDVKLDSSLQKLQIVLKEISESGNINVYNDVKFKDEYQELQGNSLYILDKNMGVGKEDEVIEYISDIIQTRKKYNDLVIIYSAEVKDLLTHEKKLQYLNEHDIDIKEKELFILYQFWPLEKVIDENQLINGMKKMISKSVYGKALSQIVFNKKLAINKAFTDLLQVDIDNLDDMIIESNIEGEKITESYESLIDSLISRNELNLINCSDVLSCEKGLLQYGEKRGDEILEEQEINSNSKYDKFRKESQKKKLLDSVYKDVMLYNVANYSVNQKYINPSMGDIYVFKDARNNQKCAGMLISQECSTIIRKNKFKEAPMRSANEFLLLLFDIVEISASTIDGNILNNLDCCVWPIKINERIYLLKNKNRSMYIKPEILDLCSMNSDGKAKISFDKEALQHKSVYAKEYYKDFDSVMKKNIDDVVQMATDANIIKRKDSNIRNMIVSFAYGIMYRDNFELQRICRVNEKHSLHIIHEYLKGIGKIGLPIVPNL